MTNICTDGRAWKHPTLPTLRLATRLTENNWVAMMMVEHATVAARSSIKPPYMFDIFFRFFFFTYFFSTEAQFTYKRNAKSTLEKEEWGLDLVCRLRASPSATSAERPARPAGQNVTKSTVTAPGSGGEEMTSELSWPNLDQELSLYHAFFWLLSGRRRRRWMSSDWGT